MHEVFPVLAGFIIGVLAQRLQTQQQRAIAIAIGSIAVGMVAVLISGEFEESWLFVLFDIAQVLVAAVIGLFVAEWFRRRAS